MKIVLDMQARQSQGSHHRGIGRYALALGQALARQAGEQIHLLVNAAFPDYALEIREDFKAWIPPERIHVFHVPRAVAGLHPENAWRMQAAEQLRESVLQNLQPDIVHISSLFEGLDDDLVTSVNLPTLAQRTSVTLHDLIPLMQADYYLRDPRMRQWYYRKLQALKNAGLLLAVSEYSRREGIAVLGLEPERVVCVPNAVEAKFQHLALSPEQVAAIKAKFGIARDFILYMGGVEYRKNIERLLAAYVALPNSLRANYALVIAGKIKEYERERLQQWQKQYGLDAKQFILTGAVSDHELIELYNLAALFVFPSLYEGFGLPVLEAMACGCPTITANNTSLPEVVGWAEATFDGLNTSSITAKMVQALTDTGFRQTLVERAAQHVKNFSWDASAQQALSAFAALHERQQVAQRVQVAVPQIRLRMAVILPELPVSAAVMQYVMRLLPALAGFYAIDCISDAATLDNLWLHSNFPQRTRQWLREHPHDYQRRLYVANPEAYDADMFVLMQEQAGTLLLSSFMNTAWQAQPMVLYQASGYSALLQPQAYAANWHWLAAAIGVLALEADAQALARQAYGATLVKYWEYLPVDSVAEQALAFSQQLGTRAARAIERFYAEHPLAQEQQVIAKTQGIVTAVQPSAADWLAVAQSLVANRLTYPAQPTLFYDVSIFVHGDHATGVHRATRYILLALLHSPPHGWRVEPIYAEAEHYRYARQMTTALLGLQPLALSDDVVDFRAGDIFLHVDLGMHIVADRECYLQQLRAKGVRLFHVVHDLLPVRLPAMYFDAGFVEHFPRWLATVCRVADGLIMTTRAGLADVQAWMRENPPQRFGQPRLGVCTLGADIQAQTATVFSAAEQALLAQFQQQPTILMVSTIEPRKGYAQTLRAFEQLWAKGIAANLVLVGKQGWNVEPLISELQQHPELGKRLYWLKFVSDALLSALYQHCSALLMASEGEGFGLPLIEAAQHGLPIIARDIAVFREIAGEHAFYFSGKEPAALAYAVEQWLALYAQGKAPQSAGIPWVTWAETAEQIKAFIFADTQQAEVAM